MQIQHDEIRLHLVEQGHGVARVRYAAHFGKASRQQHALEQSNIRLLVVDDQDARAGQ